jgi:DNA-binding NarL/FixJ family response regulator
MPAKRILIAESNDFFANAITDLLSGLGGDVVATTPKKSEIFRLVQEIEPDLLIVDYDMAKGDENGQPGIEAIKEYLPDTKILVLGFHEAGVEFVESLLQKGFDGFYNKFDSSKGLLKKLGTLLV